MAKIAKLADEWKVIYDFKPTVYRNYHDFPSVSLLVDMSLNDSDEVFTLEISFSHLNIQLDVTDDDDNEGLNLKSD